MQVLLFIYHTILCLSFYNAAKANPNTCYDIRGELDDDLTATAIYTLNNNLIVRCAFIDLGDGTAFIGVMSEHVSFGNNAQVSSCALFKDCPFHEIDVQTGESNLLYRWSKNRIMEYRQLSLSHSFDSSSYLLVTCNKELTLTDNYLLLPFSYDFVDPDKSFEAQHSGEGCYHVKHAKIRGHECKNENADFWNSDLLHFHIQSSSCYCGGCCSWNTAAVASEDNFGYYQDENTEFSCTSTPTSTTDYWIGSIISTDPTLEPTFEPTLEPTINPFEATINTSQPTEPATEPIEEEDNEIDVWVWLVIVIGIGGFSLIITVIILIEPKRNKKAVAAAVAARGRTKYSKVQKTHKTEKDSEDEVSCSEDETESDSHDQEAEAELQKFMDEVSCSEDETESDSHDQEAEAELQKFMDEDVVINDIHYDDIY